MLGQRNKRPRPAKAANSVVMKSIRCPTVRGLIVASPSWTHFELLRFAHRQRCGRFFNRFNDLPRPEPFGRVKPFSFELN